MTLATLLILVAPGLTGASGVPAGAELPYAELGTDYLEALELPAEPLYRSGLDLRGPWIEAMEPFHRVIDLGAVQLWLPLKTVRGNGSLGPGLDPDEALGWALDLIALQRGWVDQLGPRADLKAERLAELELLEAWAKAELKGRSTQRFDELELGRARRSLANLYPSEFNAGTPVLLIAPTRHHLVSLACATGLLLPSEQERLWKGELRSWGYLQPVWDVDVIPLEGGPEEGSDGLVGLAYAPEDNRSTIVHRAAHKLVGRRFDVGPQWLHEGLALTAGIDVTGQDDSPCSGFWKRDQMANMVWLPNWIEADASPYREGPSSDYFKKLLRPDREGRFTIHDIDRGRPGMQLAGPFLSPDRARNDDGLPEEVAGRPGIERGYMEFERAYTATFVHWLGQRRLGENTEGRRVLSLLVDFMADDRRHGGLEERELVSAGLRMITMKTVGASGDPERDLEAEFAAWLRSR